MTFQSTLPARGATKVGKRYNKIPLISIHAPRTGSDDMLVAISIDLIAFQSTLPARGATNVHTMLV